MKDFRLYDIADFVMDEDFIRWVQLRDPADNLFWESWLEQNPSRHLLIAEARQIVAFIQLQQKPITSADIQLEIAQVLSTIQQPKKKPEQRRNRYFLFAASIAAVLILFLLTGLPRWSRAPHTPTLTGIPLKEQTASIEKTNTTDATLPVHLPDGSTVGLAPGSSIRYLNSFTTAASREVYLSGEAFFTIAKNPAKPFRVLTGELITRVLGTSFSIRFFEKDTTICITVRTGKISVSSLAADQIENPDGLIITPNQKLVYHREVKKFQKILVEKPLFIVADTVDHSMTYEDTPVEQVFEQLGKYYGINIVFDNELLSKCTVTADLANEPFYHKLDLICKAIGAHYEIVDAQVVIQSSGCQ